MSKLLPPRPAQKIEGCADCPHVRPIALTDKTLYVCELIERLVSPYKIHWECYLEEWPDCSNCAKDSETCGDSPWDEKTPCNSHQRKEKP